MTILFINEPDNIRPAITEALDIPLNIQSINSADLETGLIDKGVNLAIVSLSDGMGNDQAILRLLDNNQIPTLVYGEISTKDAGILDSFAIFHHTGQQDVTALAEEIKKALQHPEEAHISGVSLPSFLQLIELDRKTCTLRIKSDDLRGVLYFLDGEITNAYAEGLNSEEAALEIIGWSSVTIDLHASCRQLTKDIESPLGFLLIEASRQYDEKKNKAAESAVRQGSYATKDIPPPASLEKTCQHICAAIAEIAPDSNLLITRPDGSPILEQQGDQKIAEQPPSYAGELTLQTVKKVNKLKNILNYTDPQYILLHHQKNKKLLILSNQDLIIGLEVTAETPAQLIATSLRPLLNTPQESGTTTIVCA